MTQKPKYQNFSRGKFLKWSLIGGTGAITTVLLRQFLRNANLSVFSPPESLELGNVFSFEVVTVNDQGNIIQRTWKKVKYTTYKLDNNFTIDFVYIPGGIFVMGSPESEKQRDQDESPQHRVKVPSFWMSKYPITQAQYEAIMNANPSRFRGNNHPVEKVSWYDAVKFCEIASKKLEKKIKLPSEAQWEYACRSGTQTTFSFGATLNTELANYRGSSTYADELPGLYRKETTQVGIFPPNAFGLYDLHGNVWEWCEDTYQPSYHNAPTDGSAWIVEENNKLHVLRGGSWFVDPRNCRSAVRVWDLNSVSLEDVGFRVVTT